MNELLMVQGRYLEPADIIRIRGLIADNPAWSRRRLSEALSTEWEWRNASGQLKDMAARSLLLKLEQRGLVQLPARRQRPSNRMAERRIVDRDWNLTSVTGTLREAGPLKVREVSADPAAREQYAAALARFHYLGSRGTVGENLQYAVTTETGRLLACVQFGSPAWKCRARDEFIGWDSQQKQQHLHLITNNTRFLILPQVQVPHLASWILGQVLRRLSEDWKAKYGHPIVLVETFVDRERFRGTCYRAANWIPAGMTTGRSRQDSQHTLRVPLKDVYVYPLQPRFRQELYG
jgi:Domain of unknown function (DUF4338)